MADFLQGHLSASNFIIVTHSSDTPPCFPRNTFQVPHYCAPYAASKDCR